MRPLSTIQNDPNTDPSIRVAAASSLAPYMHPKLQSTPTPRFIDLQLDVPEFTHVSDAENFLAKIALLVARGHLDIQSGQELSGLVEAWIRTQYAKDELQFKLNPPEERDTVIKIEGGLPQLPGTSISMPVINGHSVSEQLLTAPTDVVPPKDPANEFTPGEDPANEFTPAQLPDTPPSRLKAQGPHPLQKHHFAESADADQPGMNSNGQGSPETKDGDPVR